MGEKPRLKTQKEAFPSFLLELQSCGPLLKPSGLHAFWFHFKLGIHIYFAISLRNLLFWLQPIPVVSLLLATESILTRLPKDSTAFREDVNIFYIHYVELKIFGKYFFLIFAETFVKHFYLLHQSLKVNYPFERRDEKE